MVEVICVIQSDSGHTWAVNLPGILFVYYDANGLAQVQYKGAKTFAWVPDPDRAILRAWLKFYEDTQAEPEEEVDDEEAAYRWKQVGSTVVGFIMPDGSIRRMDGEAWKEAPSHE